MVEVFCQHGLGWNIYIDAHFAFIDGDLKRLKYLRKKLIKVPMPENMKAIDSEGNPINIPWPLNIHIMNALIRCHDKSYTIAYRSPECAD
jgi:hypothetical protein